MPKFILSVPESDFLTAICKPSLNVNTDRNTNFYILPNNLSIYIKAICFQTTISSIIFSKMVLQTFILSISLKNSQTLKWH